MTVSTAGTFCSGETIRQQIPPRLCSPWQTKLVKNSFNCSTSPCVVMMYFAFEILQYAKICQEGFTRIDGSHMVEKEESRGPPISEFASSGSSVDSWREKENLCTKPLARRTAVLTVYALGAFLFLLQGPTSAAWSKSFLVMIPCTSPSSSTTGKCRRPKLRKITCALSAGVSVLQRR